MLQLNSTKVPFSVAVKEWLGWGRDRLGGAISCISNSIVDLTVAVGPGAPDNHHQI